MSNTPNVNPVKAAKITKATKNNDAAVIFQTQHIDDRIYIREQKGYFQRIRRVLSWGLISLFMLLPLLQYKGHQAIHFDVAQQQFHFFSVIIFPQDFLIFCLLFILAAFLLFYLTRLYGRIWCGYACPQTIWLLMFNWIERRIEGSRSQSKALDKSKVSAQKMTKKIAKHVLWLCVSLLTSLVFMSYFIPVYELYYAFFTLEASFVIQSWVYFFALCTYVNAGWIKDKMCLHICPYARFQAVMFNKSTQLITYDPVRGESRGPRKRNQPKPEGKGDCINCNLCVEVCPVGIDIRNGLQYECINCGLCADACDAVMDKFSYAKGLIKYDWQIAPEKSWLQHIGYASVCILTLFAIIGWTLTRTNFDVSVTRDRQALYRINEQGNVENTFKIKILNKTPAIQWYMLSLNTTDNLKIYGEKTYSVKPGEHVINAVYVVASNTPKTRKTAIEFSVTDKTLKESVTKSSSFYSGDATW